MYFLKAFVRFACFDLFYMVTKGVIDFLWSSSISHMLVYEFFTTISILPIFLISDFLIHFFEKRERLLYGYDIGVMLLTVFFITALWRRIPGSWNIWNRAMDMMGNWDDVKLLCGPLLVAAVLGYGLYIWTLNSGKNRLG